MVVNSFKVVRETLVTHGESVSDRPDLALQDQSAFGKKQGTHMRIFCYLKRRLNLLEAPHIVKIKKVNSLTLSSCDHTSVV